MPAGLTTSPPPETLRQLVHELEATAAEADERGAWAPAAIGELRRSPVLGTVVPEEHGGRGGDASAVNEVVEEVARVDPSTAIILFQHLAVCSRIVEWGSGEQRRLTLPRLANGSWLAASAWSEVGAGADKRVLSTTAEMDADGWWRLNGAKAFTTGAGLADIYLVLAQTGEAAPSGQGYGGAGQTFFLVEASAPGVIAETGLDLVGMRASATGFVQLRDCRVPPGSVLGPLHQASRIIAGVRESGASLGAVALGIARSAFDLTLEHLSHRGLLEHQAVGHRLADLRGQVEAMAALVARAGRRDSADPGMTTLHSKLFVASACETVVAECQRLLGSAGFVREHPVNRLARDARAVGLMGPTSDLCRELVSRQWQR